MEWIRGPVIGRGSTATVSLATSTSSSELFALKSAELSNSMFLQKEQYFLSTLSSPYVVKYIGFSITSENNKPMYNICMEYMPGGSLHDEIQRRGGQLDEPTIRSYARNILLGLDYLHTNGLAHCDIKSKNVLISKEGAKIADFGCARFAHEVVDKSAFSGTPAFMAPEVARGEEQGFPADVWAVGCTVIEMASGCMPWLREENVDPVSVLYQIGFSSDVPAFPRWISGKGQDFLNKCLRRDPKERWTAKELLDHPFLQEMEMREFDKVINTVTSSPSCVLDQDFWDSMPALESPEELTVLEGFSSLKSNLNSPVERIKKLIGCFGDVPDWSWEEDWITVRSCEIAEDTLSSAPTASLTSDSVGYEQELQTQSSIFFEDTLLEFFRENENNINISNGITSEGYEFVSENINFEINNDNSCSLIFLLISLLFSPYYFLTCEFWHDHTAHNQR